MELGGLPRNHYGVVLADPAWRFKTWSAKGTGRSAEQHYETMSTEEICALPVSELMLPDSCLFLWMNWSMLVDAMQVIQAWGFTYKTCAFCWIKADNRQLDMFNGDIEADMKLGHWTRSNSEACLLATKGSPKRLDAGVRQAIIEPGREHSRKPDCTYERIERLVAGPYLELFARNTRKNWVSVGNETDRFPEVTNQVEMLV